MISVMNGDIVRMLVERVIECKRAIRLSLNECVGEDGTVSVFEWAKAMHECTLVAVTTLKQFHTFLCIPTGTITQPLTPSYP